MDDISKTGPMPDPAWEHLGRALQTALMARQAGVSYQTYYKKYVKDSTLPTLKAFILAAEILIAERAYVMEYVMLKDSDPRKLELYDVLAELYAMLAMVCQFVRRPFGHKSDDEEQEPPPPAVVN
jgi:hypothetical protein